MIAIMGGSTDFYVNRFHPHNGHKLMMEVTTTSFHSLEAPARVSNLFGKDLTLLCPLRKPVTRSYSLYFIVNAAEKLGLKSRFFGEDNPEAILARIPAEDRAWLEKRLAGEVERLESLIGPIKQWRRP